MKDTKVYYTTYNRVGQIKETLELSASDVEDMVLLVSTLHHYPELQDKIPDSGEWEYMKDRVLYRVDYTIGAVSEGVILSTTTGGEMSKLIEKLNEQQQV